MKNLSVVALVVAVAALGVGVFKNAPSDVQVGGFASPDIYSYLDVQGYFQQGGGVKTATPQNATYTITAADLAEFNVLTFTASTTMPALTATLPASTTFPLGANKGATRTWVIENPFTAAATTTTIAAGTGIDLQEPDGQNVVIGINNYAFLTCVRGADSGSPQDIVCLVDEGIPAD